MHSKTESISQSLQVTLKVFQERENKTNEMFHQNTTILQNEIIKSLTETQTTILEALSSFKSNQPYDPAGIYLLKVNNRNNTTSSQQQKPTRHSKHNESLQSSDKGICHDQKTEQIQNVQYAQEQKLKQIATLNHSMLKI